MQNLTSEKALDLLDAYARAWRRNDTREIASHWDSDNFLFYKAEEVQAFMHDWEDVLSYWRQNENLHDAISLRFSEATCVPAGGDTVAVTVDMRWDIRFAADASTADGAAFPHRGRTMGGDNHVLIMMGPVEGEWKIRGWSETPDAAITYLRSLYFHHADPAALDDHD